MGPISDFYQPQEYRSLIEYEVIFGYLFYKKDKLYV